MEYTGVLFYILQNLLREQRFEYEEKMKQFTRINSKNFI